MSIDLCAIRRIVENEGIAEARRLGLVPELLIGDGKTVFDFIVEHARLHGAVPSPDTIRSVTSIEVTAIAAPEPMSFYVKALFDRRNRAITSDHTRQLIDELKIDDPSLAIQRAKSIVADTMKWQFGRRSYCDPRETIDERIRKQMELEELHGTIDGFRTPWPELDVITRGMHAGEMWVLLAAKKTGKSWGTILFFRELIKQGLKPLMVTMEMASSKIIRRFDALYSELDFNDLRSGLLGIDGIDKYIVEMKRLSEEGDFWIAGDGLIRCPADVEILAHDLEPDVILIDGMYLMQPSTGRWGSKYDKVSTVADELQSMPHRLQLPMMYTSQFNRNLKEGSLIGDSGKTGFAYEIAQNADLVLAMYVNDDLKLSNRRLWSVMEHREGTDFTMLTRFDLDQMNFDFVREVQAAELMPEKSGAESSFSF